MNKPSRFALIALAAGALAPAAHAAKPAPPGAPTIASSASRVVFGSPVTISGQVPAPDNAGVSVTLESDPFPFDTFHDVTTALTTATGGYSFTNTPGANTKYRVNAKTKPSRSSSEVLVSVRRRVTRRVSDSTPAKGQRVRFAGSVYPPKDGATILIQRRSSTGYKTVATTLLKDAGTERSTYRRTIRVSRNGTFRLVVPADGAFIAGVSRRISLRVH